MRHFKYAAILAAAVILSFSLGAQPSAGEGRNGGRFPGSNGRWTHPATTTDENSNVIMQQERNNNGQQQQQSATTGNTDGSGGSAARNGMRNTPGRNIGGMDRMMGSRFGGRDGGPRMSPEQMETFRNMTPEQRMEAFRKMRDERKPKATPSPETETLVMKSIQDSTEFHDLNDNVALEWRKLTTEQRLELAKMSTEERENFRIELTAFFLSPDNATDDVKEKMANFLTEKQLFAIRALTVKQQEQASSLIENYTSASLVEKSLSDLPEEDRATLKKLLPAEKRAYLASKGFDTSLIDSLFPRLVDATSTASQQMQAQPQPQALALPTTNTSVEKTDMPTVAATN